MFTCICCYLTDMIFWERIATHTLICWAILGDGYGVFRDLIVTVSLRSGKMVKYTLR